MFANNLTFPIGQARFIDINYLDFVSKNQALCLDLRVFLVRLLIPKLFTVLRDLFILIGSFSKAAFNLGSLIYSSSGVMVSRIIFINSSLVKPFGK